MLSILERAATNFIPLLESGLQKNITTRLCASRRVAITLDPTGAHLNPWGAPCTAASAQLDENKLNAFIGKMLGDLGGVPTVRVGLRLGLFDALQEGGPATSDELAKRAGGVNERYVREWWLAQAASGYIDYDASSGKFTPLPARAWVNALFILFRQSRAEGSDFS